MLLNKKQAAKLMIDFVNNELTVLKNPSASTFVPKNDSWGIYIRGADFEAISSFCGIDFLNDCIFFAVWKNVKYASNRIKFLEKLPELWKRNLKIGYDEGGEYFEERITSFKNWGVLDKSSYCYLVLGSYNSKEQALIMLRSMISIFLCFCIWNKTGLIDDPTREYENMEKIEFQKNLSKSHIADKSIDNCEKNIKITPEKLFLTKDRPKNVVCSKVIIVGPYPTVEFVKAVKRDLKPEIIYVNVDESWKPKEIDSIKEIESVKLIPVRTENGIGIVHAKMYYVEYKNDNGLYTRLFFGSVNASQNSVSNNSEFWVSFRLIKFDEENRKIIKAYFKNLINENVIKVQSQNVVLKDEKKKIVSILAFPEIVKSGEIKSFYNWIRSGIFLIKYEPDSSFGYLPIKLIKEKMPEDKLKEYLKNTKLEGNGYGEELRYPYASDKKSEKFSQEQWKLYTVDTRNGLWLSYECSQEKEYPPESVSRSTKINFIANLKDKDVKKIISECVTFIGTMRKKYDWIAVPDREKMEKKINADIQLAKNKEFKKRYMTGYASINITTNSSDQLEKIANDFIESCAIKNSRQSPRNKMACIFKDRFAGWPSNKIHDELLKNWDAYKDELINYYKMK